MKIQLGGLSEGLHEYHFRVATGDLNLGPEFRQPVAVSASVEKIGNQVFLSASLEARCTFTCDRCLTEFERVLEPRYRMIYVFEEAEADRFDPSEVHVISPALTAIDIADDVRQTLHLSVPLKLLCSETCKGLCPHCGTNWNLASCSCHDERTDQRWEALKKLQNRD
jgi:uncharacterized protein